MENKHNSFVNMLLDMKSGGLRKSMTEIDDVWVIILKHLGPLCRAMWQGRTSFLMETSTNIAHRAVNKHLKDLIYKNDVCRTVWLKFLFNLSWVTLDHKDNIINTFYGDSYSEYWDEEYHDYIKYEDNSWSEEYYADDN
jgi:hypothetical protein